jgi:hypothetical protein
MNARVCLALVLLAVSVPLFGELAPEVYEQMQREAPELLQVEVAGVDFDRELGHPQGCGLFEFEVSKHAVVKAKVVAVTRTRAGVKPGDVIEIRYTSVKRCSGFAGPRSIPMLAKGDRVQAWLAKGTRSFEPAARGASFEKWR